MKYTIEHEIPGRIRVRLYGRVPESDVDALESLMTACPGVSSACVYPRIGSLAITYGGGEETRASLLAAMDAVDAASIEKAKLACPTALSVRTHSLLMDIAMLVGSHFARKWFLPAPLRVIRTIWHYRLFLKAALNSLLHARLDVPVLDAAAIGISFVKGDFATAASTMFLLDLGETLEDYTRARSENQLIYSLLGAPENAQLVDGDREITVPSANLKSGDLVVVRTGMPISVDGVVERGVAMVNQSTLTGEPLAVERTVGDDVFAGTACEEGEIFVRVKAATGETKIRSIVSLVEMSESMKSDVQTKRERLADRIVPWNFLLAGIVALTTRSLVKTSAALMVDYSCALKLTGSISVLSAMSQAAKAGFTVKGSKHFEAFAQADTIVFDKTGTLTEAQPQVKCIIALDGWNRTQVLRFSACLEEHFPHPVARAVVRAAAEKNLKHRERHAAVEYIVAHGIASSLDGKRAVIGSRHFVVEDEGVVVSEEEQQMIDAEASDLSTLYLAVDGKLVGVIGIDDPLKSGVSEAVEELRNLGFERIIMLTGDNEKTASRVAQAAGITEFRADMLPEDKHEVVEQLKAEGCKVVMVGDGVNDSPALSAATVGVAMGQGTAIAKEVADITLSEGNLSSLVQMRKLSQGLMGRMDTSFAQTIGFNSALLALGVGGIITPQTSSLLHNASTIALSMHSSRSYNL